MAVTTIAHTPDLTKERARHIFRAHFQGKYKVEDWKGPGSLRDFLVIRNAFVGVAVKLEQGTDETKFVYAGTAPKMWARLFFFSLWSLLLWNGLTNEVRSFIETAPEFK